MSSRTWTAARRQRRSREDGLTGFGSTGGFEKELNLDERCSATVEDNVTEIPEPARDQPLDYFIDGSDEETGQSRGQVNCRIRYPVIENAVEQNAEYPVLEKVNCLFRLTHQIKGPDDDGCCHSDQPQEIGAADV